MTCISEYYTVIVLFIPKIIPKSNKLDTRQGRTNSPPQISNQLLKEKCEKDTMVPFSYNLQNVSLFKTQSSVSVRINKCEALKRQREDRYKRWGPHGRYLKPLPQYSDFKIGQKDNMHKLSYYGVV